MEKTTFFYQRHDSQLMTDLRCIAVGGIITWLLRRQFALSRPLCAGILVALSLALWLCSCLLYRTRLYRGKGEYRFERDRLCIECEGREHRIADVKEMTGGIRSSLSGRIATLSIETPHDIVEIYSVPLGAEEGFENSSVYPLCQFVLAHFPELQSVTDEGQAAGAYRYAKHTLPTEETEESQ